MAAIIYFLLVCANTIAIHTAGIDWRTWQFWVCLVCICGAWICGFEIGRKEW